MISKEEQFIKYFNKLMVPAFFSTVRIVIATVILGFTIGFLIAILMTVYGPEGLKPNKKIYKFLDFIVNTIRSFPVLILIVAILPITRAIIGTTIGEKAAILPLTVAASAFIARMLENSFKMVDKQLIEAAKSFGASNTQIVFKVIVKESIPSIVSTITIAIINNIACSTVAGAVGGGGLGAIALNYGYQNFNNLILYTCVVVLAILVQLTQTIGNWVYKKTL